MNSRSQSTYTQNRLILPTGARKVKPNTTHPSSSDEQQSSEKWTRSEGVKRDSSLGLIFSLPPRSPTPSPSLRTLHACPQNTPQRKHRPLPLWPQVCFGILVTNSEDFDGPLSNWSQNLHHEARTRRTLSQPDAVQTHVHVAHATQSHFTSLHVSPSPPLLVAFDISRCDDARTRDTGLSLTL